MRDWGRLLLELLLQYGGIGLGVAALGWLLRLHGERSRLVAQVEELYRRTDQLDQIAADVHEIKGMLKKEV